MKLLNKILLLAISALLMNCEEPTSGSSSEDSLESTLENSECGNGITGNIDEYFYDLDELEVPYVNSQFYRYSGLSIIEPLAFDAESDTLNFITVSDYVLSFSPDELIDDMIALDPFDETIDGEDINGDGEITGGSFSGIYRFEEINFSHTYTDVIKLEWDEDNERYMVVSAPGDSSPLSHRYIVGNPDSLYENNRYDVGEFLEVDVDGDGIYDEEDGDEYLDAFGPDMNDDYDSLVYITQINFNDLNGFYFSDDDENGYWDSGEQWDLPDSTTYQYYFDTNQLSSVDSIYSSQNLEITHDFSFSKSLISTDSLMFKISTDCNDNGVWDGAEVEDTGNGLWDPAEPFLNQGGDDDVEYDIGEPFLDRNCNGQWDDAEAYVDENEDGEWNDEPFTDTGNGILDVAEVCADGGTNCSYDLMYSMSDRPNVLIASYTGNDWTAYENIDVNTVVTPRWGENSFELIQSYNQLETKSKTTAMVDKVETVYSYQIIENTFEDGKDYSISKVIWDDSSDGDRSVAYHLYRKDDQSGDIVELIHDSYFILPTTTPGSSIDGGSFGDYLVFDNLPTEQTYLYTYNGLLRDGEKHQTSRTAYSPQTNAQYYIVETYEISSDTLTIPQLNDAYDLGEEFSDDNENQQWDDGENHTDEFTLLTDAFKITRTKNSIMQGSGLELVELNNIWLAKGYGVVKDEMEFRFNEPDDFDGFYRLELINCRHCGEDSSNRSGTNGGSTEINFNQLQNVGQSSDSYKKLRTFGLQKLDFDSQP